MVPFPPVRTAAPSALSFSTFMAAAGLFGRCCARSGRTVKKMVFEPHEKRAWGCSLAGQERAGVGRPPGSLPGGLGLLAGYGARRSSVHHVTGGTGWERTSVVGGRGACQVNPVGPRALGQIRGGCEGLGVAVRTACREKGLSSRGVGAGQAAALRSGRLRAAGRRRSPTLRRTCPLVGARGGQYTHRIGSRAWF